MLSRFFKCPVRLQELRCSPAGSPLEDFAHNFWQSGYAKTTGQRHIRVAEHFLYWTDRKGSAPAALNESSIASFEHHLHRCRCPRYGCTYPWNRQNGVRLFLRYLCDAGIATDSVAEQTAPVEPVLLTSFVSSD